LPASPHSTPTADPPRQANGARDTGARDGRPAPTGGSGSKIGLGPHGPTGGSLQAGIM